MEPKTKQNYTIHDTNAEVTFNQLNDCESDWMKKAYCKNKGHTQYFPTRGAHSANIKKHIAQTCEQCNVKTQCLNFAIVNEIRHGIWGGKSERQRRELRRLHKKNLNKTNTTPT